jgi:hypothetical protein
MSSINNLLNSGYYQLGGSSSGANTAAANPASLAQALSASTGTSSSSGSAAYLLNISPQAQQYLNGLNTSTAAPSAISSGATNSGFTLTPDEKDTIATILAKYKDAPQTQATFNQIQDALSAVGLGANQLAQKDQIKNFSSTELLVADLNGNYDDAKAMVAGNSTAEQGKASSYIQQIASQWKNLASSSTAADAAPADAVSAASSSGGA